MQITGGVKIWRLRGGGLRLTNASHFFSPVRRRTIRQIFGFYLGYTFIRARAHISFLSISPYFSPTNKKHSPHFSTSKLSSSTSKRPREGACGTAFLQLTIHVPEQPLRLENVKVKQSQQQAAHIYNQPRLCSLYRHIGQFFFLPLNANKGEELFSLYFSPQVVFQEIMAGGRNPPGCFYTNWAKGLTVDFKVMNRWPGPGRYIKTQRSGFAIFNKIKKIKASRKTDS